MPRNQDKACLHFELDLRGCGPCTEPQPQPQPQPKSDSRGRREEREHSHKKYTQHHSDLRAESPPIAIRAGTRPPPAERHTTKHRAPSKTRARSPVAPVVYPQQEEVPITHHRRSKRVHRRETAPVNPEEATAPRRHNSSSSRRRDEDHMAPRGYALPQDAQFQGWVPEGRPIMNFFTEQVPAPPPPQHVWTPEHDDDPAAPLNWVPPSVEIPPPPPPRRRYTSDSARHADPSPPGAWYVDDATAEPTARDTRKDPLHRSRNFSNAAETERPAARESRKRDHNRPTTDSSARKDAHRKRDHAQDRTEQGTHYSVRFEYVHPTPDGPPGGWYQHEDFSHAHTTYQHTAYQTHFHADPYASGTPYDNEPPSFHTYTEGESYEWSSYPRPSASRGDYQEHHRSGGRHRHEYPPNGAAEAVPPVKDLTEHWAVLGLQEGADDAAIRSAYKKMALKCHPDRQVGKDEREKKKMEELFLKVKAAHDVLLKK
ncbi:uncharacterized protein H6S33_010923 [Morchella sextelata]|uniref:uncharacterized protein n=1 Tax=Morchella sextelata TaxID=1174677 RepID=UPI001D037274|nr:uncharacterized protein H6S33_010923 [Morchella sextelata]KAH0611658.1 hypothetical protein H6S33_010923 [Morchella sextelata]